MKLVRVRIGFLGFLQVKDLTRSKFIVLLELTNRQHLSMRVFKTHIRVEVLIARFLFLLLGSSDWLFSSLGCVFFSLLLTTLELTR